MSKGFDIPSNKHLGNSHDYWKAPQSNSKQIVVQPLKWLPIDRDENGFATEECLDKIFSHLPVVLHHNKMGGGYYVLNPQTESLKLYFREGVKTSNVVLKRYTAGKGKSLKWYEWVMNPNTRESERVLRYAECTAVIDTNQLDGDVVEVPYEEYKEWWDNNYHYLGVTGL